MNEDLQSPLWECSARLESALPGGIIPYVKRLLDRAVSKPGTRLRRL
jgi:hypothetical protein